LLIVFLNILDGSIVPLMGKDDRDLLPRESASIGSENNGGTGEVLTPRN